MCRKKISKNAFNFGVQWDESVVQELLAFKRVESNQSPLNEPLIANFAWPK